MKKSHIAATACLTLASTAHAAPKLYASLVPELQATYSKETNLATGEVTSGWERPALGGNDSRIGVRGEEKLTDDLSATYRLEYRVRLDREMSSQTDHRTDPNVKHLGLEPRNLHVGIKHRDYGTLSFGRMRTPDSSQYTRKDTGWDGQRLNNSVLYESPKIGNVDFKIQYGMDENKTSTLTGNNDRMETDVLAGVVRYDNKKAMLGAGFFFANGGNTDAICQEGFRRPRGLSSSTLNRLCVKDAWHVSGSYYLNETYEVGLIHQQVRYQNNPTHRGTGFSLTRAVPDSKNSSYMHYTYTDNRGGRVGKSHYLLVGVDRGISKNLVAFAELDFDRTKTSEVKSEAITGTLGLAFRF